MQLLLATRNRAKVREIARLLGDAPPFTLIGLEDAGIAYDPAEESIETAKTFRGNALLKARHFARRSGMVTIAEDSGLVVHALGNEPGVRSKRYSGRDDLAGERLDEANNQLLLERLEGIGPEDRTAHYVCAVAVVTPQRDVLSLIGTCAGRIAEKPTGSEGFGYDPLFLLPDIGVTFGELALDEKNRRSHRARAFRALAATLPRFIART